MHFRLNISKLCSFCLFGNLAVPNILFPNGECDWSDHNDDDVDEDVDGGAIVAQWHFISEYATAARSLKRRV